MKIGMRLGVVTALVLGCVAGAVAQNPPQAPQQPQPPQGQQPLLRRMPRAGMQNPDRAALMRAQIEERFGQRVQQELGLNDQQMERLRTAGRANEDRMRELNQREADQFRAVMDQLRPGVGANQDSLGRLLDGIAAVRVQRAQSEQQELRELGQFLNPVQRARLLMMRRQLMDRVNAIRHGGVPGDGPGGPGMGPGNAPVMGPMMRPARPGAPPPDSLELVDLLDLP